MHQSLGSAGPSLEQSTCGGLASDWGFSDRLFSACLPWGWDLGGQDRREGDLVSPDWAGEGEIISSKMAGRPKYSLFFLDWNYKPGGAGAMVGKGLRDPRVQQTCSGKKWWGAWTSIPCQHSACG